MTHQYIRFWSNNVYFHITVHILKGKNVGWVAEWVGEVMWGLDVVK